MKREAKILTFEQMREGSAKILSNAKELVSDADLLFAHQKFARTYTLAHLACEELSKILILFRAATKLVTKREVDWKELDKRLRDHNGKIRMGFIGDYILTTKPNEPQRTDGPMSAIEHWYVFNNLKNESLYTTLLGDNFQAPADVISPSSAEWMLGVAQTRVEFHDQFEPLVWQHLSDNAESPHLFERYSNFEQLEREVGEQATSVREIVKLWHSKILAQMNPPESTSGK